MSVLYQTLTKHLQTEPVRWWGVRCKVAAALCPDTQQRVLTHAEKVTQIGHVQY